jgi:hypothetical protein
MEKPVENINYTAFQDDDKVSFNDNLKLPNKKSRFANNAPSQKVSPAQFDKKVADYNTNTREMSNKIGELCKKYTNAIDDKLLPQNRGPIQDNIEKEIIAGLVAIGDELNNDQSKPEGVGSIGLINLLLKINLKQRDQINELGYKVAELERQK